MTGGLRRILLVEDSTEDVELTVSALAENRLANAVDVARDGAEAIEYLDRRGAFANRDPGDPLVVLLDLKMPRVDGIEVLRWIRQHPRLRRLPVVMLTSSREESDLVRSYDLGVNAYVVKPVDFTHFVDSVRQLGCFWALINEPPPPASPGD